MSPAWDVVGLGDCDVDLFVRVPHLPGWDEKVAGDLLGIEGGGVAANFCCAAARLGLRTALVSSVGDDQFGKVALDSLRSFGVDVGGVAVRDGVPTYFCTVQLDGRGEKALTIARTETFFPRWEDLDLDRLSSTRVLHTAPFDLEVAAKAAAHAREGGAAVSVDLEPTMLDDGLDSALPLLDATTVLFVNRLTVASLFGEGRHREAAARLLEVGPEVVVTTLGDRGAYARTEGEEISVPAHRVEVRDTTGAGDCFVAGFWVARLGGAPLQESLELASAAAALSIRTVGARSSLPSLPEVEAFLAEGSRR